MTTGKKTKRFPESPFIGSAELASLLGVDQGTVRGMRRQGVLPPSFRLGAKLWRGRRAEILEWLERIQQAAE